MQLKKEKYTHDSVVNTVFINPDIYTLYIISCDVCKFILRRVLYTHKWRSVTIVQWVGLVVWHLPTGLFRGALKSGSLKPPRNRPVGKCQTTSPTHWTIINIYIYISDRFSKNMPAISVLAVFNTVFINPDIYWHRMLETEQGMP